MAGTGDNMIAAAETELKNAQQAFESAGRAQASPGHSTRLRDAERTRDAAASKLAATRQQWRR